MNGAPQEIKIKTNESRLLRLYQENSTENSAEKDFKEDSKFNELWNFSIRQKKKKKKKENTQIQRILFPWYYLG